MNKRLLTILITCLMLTTVFGVLSVSGSNIKNSSVIEPKSAGKPDLVVKNIANLDKIETGEDIKFEVTIKNQGSGKAEGQFEIRVYRDGLIVAGGSDHVNGLAAGATHSYTFTNWWGVKDKHSFHVLVDPIPNDVISESNEVNNDRWETFKVGDEPESRESRAKTLFGPFICHFPLLERLLQLPFFMDC